MTAFTVETLDLRQALQAVIVHADPDPENPVVHRVRLEVGGDVTVTATNRFTAAAALVSIRDSLDGEVDTIDLAPGDVKEVLALFKVDTKGAGDEVLRIEADADHVRFTDASGLFDGKSYRLPRRASLDKFPDIRKLVAAVLARPAATPERLEVNGRLMGLFSTAAKAYGETLTVEPTGDRTSLVIGCGESFIGLLMPVSTSEERAAELDEWRRGWLRRLPGVDPERAEEVAVGVRASLAEFDVVDEDQGDGGGDGGDE